MTAGHRGKRRTVQRKRSSEENKATTRFVTERLPRLMETSGVVDATQQKEKLPRISIATIGATVRDSQAPIYSQPPTTGYNRRFNARACG